MNQILFAAFAVFLVSCAGTKKAREINEDKLDGLKYESLLRYDSKRLDSHLKKNDALALCHKGEYGEAEEAFKKELDKKIKSYLYWNKISTCYILQKKYTKAQRFLNIALSTSSTKREKAVILNNQGLIQLEKENYEEAKAYFKKAIELSPRALTPRYNLTQILLKFSLFAAAEKELKLLLKSNSKDIDFLASLAHLKLMQKKYQSSLKLFAQVPVKYRSRDDIATNMATAYFMLGKIDQAQNILGNSDKLIPHYRDSQAKLEKAIERKKKGGKL